MAQTAVGLVKQAAVEAVQAEKPLELRFGSVVSSSPLTVRVEEKLLLTSAFLLIPERLTDLLPGDRVALLRVQGGGRYLLLDRLGGAVRRRSPRAPPRRPREGRCPRAASVCGRRRAASPGASTGSTRCGSRCGLSSRWNGITG